MTHRFITLLTLKSLTGTDWNLLFQTEIESFEDAVDGGSQGGFNFLFIFVKHTFYMTLIERDSDVE